MSHAALEGIRILDFSHVYQGPVGTQILADYGADVIKVERPGSGHRSRGDLAGSSGPVGNPGPAAVYSMTEMTLPNRWGM